MTFCFGGCHPGYDCVQRRMQRPEKLVLAPDAVPMQAAVPHVGSTLVKTIARAFQRQKLLETGQYDTIKEAAKAEKIYSSYVSRVLRLTLLAPATVEAILAGRPVAAPTLQEAMVPIPVEWPKQAQCRAIDSTHGDRTPL